MSRQPFIYHKEHLNHPVEFTSKKELSNDETSCASYARNVRETIVDDAEEPDDYDDVEMKDGYWSEQNGSTRR